MATLVEVRWRGRLGGSSAPKSSAVPDLRVRVVEWGISSRSSDSGVRVWLVVVVLAMV